jgi:hypothetical protein
MHAVVVVVVVVAVVVVAFPFDVVGGWCTSVDLWPCILSIQHICSPTMASMCYQLSVEEWRFGAGEGKTRAEDAGANDVLVENRFFTL